MFTGLFSPTIVVVLTPQSPLPRRTQLLSLPRSLTILPLQRCSGRLQFLRRFRLNKRLTLQQHLRFRHQPAKSITNHDPNDLQAVWRIMVQACNTTDAPLPFTKVEFLAAGNSGSTATTTTTTTKAVTIPARYNKPSNGEHKPYAREQNNTSIISTVFILEHRFQHKCE